MKTFEDPKYQEYYQRNSFWQGIAINHISFSINLFLTVTLAFLGFMVNESNLNNIDLILTLKNINWKITFLSISIITGGLSIVFGTICVLTRIADFSLTRNSVYIRKRFYSNANQLDDGNKSGLLKTKKKRIFGNIFSVIFYTNKYLIKNSLLNPKKKNENRKKEINSFFEEYQLLEKLSWKNHISAPYVSGLQLLIDDFDMDNLFVFKIKLNER